MTKPTLRLHEELILLSLHDTRGTHTSGFAPGTGIAGGLLVELLLANRIRLGGKKDNEVIVINDRLSGDHSMDQWFDRIRRSPKPKSLASWKAAIAQDRLIVPRLIERLWFSGYIRRESRPILWLFERDVYPVQNRPSKNALRERMRNALAGDGPIDARTAAIILLAHNTHLLAAAVDAPTRKGAKARIKALARGDHVSDRPDAARLAARMTPAE